ncbi:MAG: CopG family transcriptional regulator [Peptococcaceae bacterium]
MEYQNITLSIPKDILRKVKHIAIEKQTSVSGLLARILEELIQKEETYVNARERHLAILNRNIDLGTQGIIKWSRRSLHER